MKRITTVLVAAFVLTVGCKAEAEILSFDEVNPPDNADSDLVELWRDERLSIPFGPLSRRRYGDKYAVFVKRHDSHRLRVRAWLPDHDDPGGQRDILAALPRRG